MSVCKHCNRPKSEHLINTNDVGGVYLVCPTSVYEEAPKEEHPWPKGDQMAMIEGLRRTGHSKTSAIEQRAFFDGWQMGVDWCNSFEDAEVVAEKPRIEVGDAALESLAKLIVTSEKIRRAANWEALCGEAYEGAREILELVARTPKDGEK